MFDDPNHDLQWLEDALLEDEARELPKEPEEEASEEEIVPQKHPRRKKRHTAAEDLPRTVFDDEELYDSTAVLDTEPKPKGIGGLVILAILEIAGIAAVALWWAKWLL